ncbi:MAG: sugar transferase [Paludibacteraceae bacterium]|nr:sugar transferase [Paludibacteraceae bacterium]
MYQHYIKRILDIIIGLIAFPFVCLDVLFAAPFIYFTDRGPIFYNAVRNGFHRVPFRMFKLRTMYVDSPNVLNADGSTFNSDNDPRVTPIGKFLRKTSLDEFPQFINILLGDMSLIGPRPKQHIPTNSWDDLSDDCKHGYDVKPGITGYAQAYGRNSLSQDEKYRMDAYYADHISFKLDAQILWDTVFSVITRKNINTIQDTK